MANNRMYIRCMVCGEKCYIGKSFGMGYDIPRMAYDMGKTLDRFFYDHVFCHNGALLVNVTCDGLYEIVYERKENEYMKEVD